jgi:hypothetical protein
LSRSSWRELTQPAVHWNRTGVGAHHGAMIADRQKALGPSGATLAQSAINPETQYADLRYEPDPTRQGERDRLGLLGRLAAHACIIEVYSEAPQAEDFRACLPKHLAVWQQGVCAAKSESKKRDEPPPREDAVASFLWIIAAGAPATLVTKLKLEHSPSGRRRSTCSARMSSTSASSSPASCRAIARPLLVRPMAAGPLLAPAVAKVAALPPDAYERAIAEPILRQFQQMLGQDSSQDPDEQKFIMAMLKSWEEGNPKPESRHA